MRWAATAVGLVIAAIAIVGLVSPIFLSDATTLTLTPVGLYISAALRVAFGLVLIGASANSRVPRTLRILGAVLILAGITTPFIGVDRANTMLDWWSAQGVVLMRIWACLAVFLGLFVVYAVTPRRGASRS